MSIERPWHRALPWVTAFAVSMAFLESAVVVYLRQLYYPEGFAFPLAPIQARIAVTEGFRELATLIMLLAPGALLTRQRLGRMAWFCFCFGVWDIFYYVFLKAILDWPATLFDQDILFLLPVIWVGPVLAPCLVSVGLIALAVVLLRGLRRRPELRLTWLQWGGLLLCGALVLYTFIEGPITACHIAQGPMPSSNSAMALDHLRDYIPARFLWWVFLLAGAGFLVVLGSIQRSGR